MTAAISVILLSPNWLLFQQDCVTLCCCKHIFKKLILFSLIKKENKITPPTYTIKSSVNCHYTRKWGWTFPRMISCWGDSWQCVYCQVAKFSSPPAYWSKRRVGDVGKRRPGQKKKGVVFLGKLGNNVVDTRGWWPKTVHCTLQL